MVSGSNEQCSQLDGKQDQDMYLFHEVVDSAHAREMKSDWNGEIKKTEFGRGRTGEDRAPEVHADVQEPNLESLLSKPQASPGVENRTIRQPLSDHHCRGLNCQRKLAYKHRNRASGNAEARMILLEQQRSVLQAAPGLKRRHRCDQASSAASPLFSISQNHPCPRQVDFWSHTATLEVA